MGKQFLIFMSNKSSVDLFSLPLLKVLTPTITPHRPLKKPKNPFSITLKERLKTAKDLKKIHAYWHSMMQKLLNPKKQKTLEEIRKKRRKRRKRYRNAQKKKKQEMVVADSKKKPETKEEALNCCQLIQERTNKEKEQKQIKNKKKRSRYVYNRWKRRRWTKYRKRNDDQSETETYKQITEEKRKHLSPENMEKIR